MADFLHDADPWRHVDLSGAASGSPDRLRMDAQQLVQVSFSARSKTLQDLLV